jgi:hypothetical protein
MTLLDRVEADRLKSTVGLFLREMHRRVFAKDTKLTLVVRVPGDADAYLLFGDDEIADVIETLKRAQTDAEDA